MGGHACRMIGRTIWLVSITGVMVNHNFDFLKRVYQEDPEVFYEYTRNAIDTFIASLPVERQRRAKGVQWRIYMELRHLDPTERMDRMIELFWYRVGEFQHMLNGGK